MSTIAEALKKVEKKRESVTNKAPLYGQAPAQPQIHVTHITQAHKINYWFVGILAVVVFIVGVIFAKSSQGNRNTVVRQSQVISREEIQENKADITPAPSFKQASPLPIIRDLITDSNFRLSGIIFSEDEPTAIINNEIVKEGDAINGATVEFIEKDRVLLSYEGKELTLKVK